MRDYAIPRSLKIFLLFFLFSSDFIPATRRDRTNLCSELFAVLAIRIIRFLSLNNRRERLPSSLRTFRVHRHCGKSLRMDAGSITASPCKRSRCLTSDCILFLTTLVRVKVNFEIARAIRAIVQITSASLRGIAVIKSRLIV